MARRKSERPQGTEDTKRLVEELGKAKAYSERLLQSMVDGLGVIDLQGRMIDANNAILQMVGLKRQEVLGAPLGKFMSEKDVQRVTANVEQVIAGTPLRSMELVLIARDGTEIPASLSANLVRDAEGNPMALFAVFRDIRETKRLISELEQSKAYIESMFNALADPITVVDVNSRFIAVNKAAIELLGYREDELIGCPTSKLLVPRERHLAGEMTAKFVATGKTIEYERTLLTKNGVEIPVVFHGAPLRDAKGEVVGSIAVARDMRDIKSLIGELEHRKAFVEHLFSALADAVIVTDREGTIVTVNRAATELLGYREDELVGQNTRVLLVPEQRHLGGTGRKEAIAKGDSVQYERKHQTKDGVEIPVLLHTSPLRDSQGAIIGSISVIRDISEIKSFITRLTRSEERHRALLEYAPVPIGVVDGNNIVKLWNRQAEKHMGYKAEEIIGKSTRMLVPDDLYEEGKWLMREVREKGYVKDYETERINSNGVRLLVEVTIAALRDEGGNFIGAEFIVRDISERKRLEREIKAREFYHALSIIDELTGLYNYRHFHELLTQGLRRSERYSHPLSLLMIDIDNFKRYQDVNGHIAGDEALKAIAQIMRNTVRGVDMVARYGGEEFAIILPETTKEVAAIAAERVRNATAETILPTGDRLTISVGVASYPADAESKEQLICQADQALYRAKKQGKNRTCIWSSEEREYQRQVPRAEN
jgi:diguanylate cyclase (GGDEF)-like protein/PAS domain S-box-containing protein